MEARLHELRADSSQASREEINKIERKLSDVKRNIADGYEDLKEDTIASLNDWLSDDRDSNASSQS